MHRRMPKFYLFLSLLTTCSIVVIPASAQEALTERPFNSNGDAWRKPEQSQEVPEKIMTGEDFPVSDHTGNTTQRDPQLAADAAGNFIIVWKDERNGNADIYAQRFDADGVKIDTNFRVNDDTGSRIQDYPDVAMGEDGAFVITWADQRTAGTSKIYAQLYDQNGTKIGANFIVNESAILANGQPAIVMDAENNLIIAWYGQQTADNYDIFCQRFSSSGGKIGSYFKVNEDPNSRNQQAPQIAMDAAGNFTITWSDYRNGTNNTDIYAQRYDADGAKINTNFKVNGATASSALQEAPAIAMCDSGAFVITWQDNRLGDSNLDVYAQLYNANGDALGTNFKVNDNITTSSEWRPRAAMDDLGNFVITWTHGEYHKWDIFAKQYDASGTALSTNYQVDSDAEHLFQSSYSRAIIVNNKIIFTWVDSRIAAQGMDIYAKIEDFRLVETPVFSPDSGSFSGSVDVTVSCATAAATIHYTTNGAEPTESDSVTANGATIKLTSTTTLKARAFLNGYIPSAITSGVYTITPVNVAPAAPTLSSPANNVYTNNTTPHLTWNVPRDDNGDPLHFRIEIATDAGFTNQISGSPFESKTSTTGFNPTPPLAQGSGSCGYALQNALTEGSYFWRVSAWDGTIYGASSDLFNFIIDTTPPLASQHDPAQNALNVPIDTDIIVHVSDGGSGVKQSSIGMKLNGNIVSPEITGISADYMLTFDPATDFDYNQTVLVTIDAQDEAGNQMVTESFHFTTYSPANVAPAIPLLSTPANNSYTNNTTPQLSWAVPVDNNDDPLHFKIEVSFDSEFTHQTDGSPFESRVSTTGFDPAPPLAQGSGSCGYALQHALTEGSYFWRVFAWDGGLYSASSNIYSFIIDTTAPAISQCEPAKDAIDVSIDSDIILHVSDDGSGVKQSSIAMKVNDIAVNPVITGSAADFTLTFNPPTDFTHHQTVTVTVNAQDETGNQMSTESYSFTTMTSSNSVPDMPTLNVPINNSYTNNTKPILTWNVPRDENDDSLHFRIEIATNTGFTNQISGSPFESKVSTTGFDPAPPLAQGSGTCSYTLQNTLTEGSYFWRVSAWDDAQYGAVSDSWCLTLDMTPPLASQHNPSKNATNIPIDANIIVHIIDSGSGVKHSSIIMKVDDIDVIPVITGSIADFTLTFDPPTDFGYHQTVTVAVDAQDLAGNVMSTDFSSFTTIDEIAPLIMHNSVNSVTARQSVSISAEITDVSGIQSASLYYRQGGAGSFIQLSMISDGFTFSATIPAAGVNERGVEYYLVAFDNLGNESTLPANFPAEPPFVIQVYNNNFESSAATPAMVYRMISIPFNPDDCSIQALFEDDFGSYDDRYWRLLKHLYGVNSEYGKSDFTALEPGQGCWLITRGAKSLDVGSGKSVTTAHNFVITLKPGWNQIGNPFTFPVNWSHVIKNSIENRLVAYEGNVNEPSGFDYTRRQLLPWEGYFVKNTGSVPTLLEIPPIADTSAIIRKRQSHFLSSIMYDENDWIIQLTAQCRRSVDKDNYLGCLHHASAMWDENDFSEAPAMDNSISLYFNHPDWPLHAGKYTGDFRSPAQEGLIWNFSIDTDFYGELIELTLAEIVNLPDNWCLVLADLTNGIKIPLQLKQKYSYLSMKGELTKSFQLIAGNNDFFEKNLVQISQLPDHFSLQQNYPNPFNTHTRIQFQLASPCQVKLYIYNLTGQKIKTLLDEEKNAGRFSTIWNGKNNTGHTVPSGVYLLSMETDHYHATRKIVLTK